MNQGVVGSNPAGRGSFTQKGLHMGAGLFASRMRAEG